MTVTPPRGIEVDTWSDFTRWARSAFLCGLMRGYAPPPAKRTWN
jgi:hypothetical protein